MGGDVIVIDEAAHISLDLFYEAVVPMLELNNTSLLAISTPLDEFNYYSKLVEMEDENGQPFFNTVKAGRVCDDCMRLPHKQMFECTHVVTDEHWKSGPKGKRLKMLYQGDEARGLREMGGIAASSMSPCFDRAIVQALFETEPYEIEHSPDAIYMTIDPNGAGPSSFGIVSGIFEGPLRVVSAFYSCFGGRRGGDNWVIRGSAGRTWPERRSSASPRCTRWAAAR